MDTHWCICSNAEETPLHLFRDCTESKRNWLSIIPPLAHHLFFTPSFDQWVEMNCNFKDYSWENLSWNVVFIIICWWLWKQRNEKMFNGRNLGVNTQFLRRQVKYVMAACDSNLRTPTSSREILVCWKLPLSDWIKLNCDGASKGENRLASCGGVLWDQTGKWLRGYAANLGIASVVEAEIWGVYYGLNLAWMEGYRRIVVSSDSKTTLHLLQNNIQLCHPLTPLIMNCRSLMSRDWILRFEHTYREDNRVANGLANWGSTQSQGLHIITIPPTCCNAILWEDCLGISFARLISN